MALKQDHEISELFDAQCHIYKHMYNRIESMLLRCCVQLGIPDIVHKHNKPITVSELVAELGVPPEKSNCLQRFMRVLVLAGFFAMSRVDETQEQGYVLTESSKLLLKDIPTSLTPAVVGMLHPLLLSSWFSLADWFKGNEVTPFETHHGMNLWDYSKQHLEFSDLLNEGMASDSRLACFVVKEHKEIFEGLNSLVDVGGGTGTLARTIADTFPHMKCIVLDLPHVVANLTETDNLRFIAGDMFQSIPNADAIVFKAVLHNWSDEDCLRILKRCREAIPSKDEGGKLILIEMVIDDKKDDDRTKTRLLLDMEMMLLCNGKERSEKEWKMLFLEAGFSHYKVTPTSGLNSIIEAYP